MSPATQLPTAVVTGGGGALGKALAKALMHAGCRVHAPGREELDVADPRSVEAYFARLSEIDLLVANAGSAEDGPVVRMAPGAWDGVLATNLTGAFRCARAAARSMVRRRCGHIVAVGSRSGLTGPAGQANYAAAKAGLTGLCKSLAAELGGRGVRVNCVLPGFLETRFTAGVTPKRRAEVLAEHSLGRFNTPADAARFIAFLHTSMPHTSGQVFSLDSRTNP